MSSTLTETRRTSYRPFGQRPPLWPALSLPVCLGLTLLANCLLPATYEARCLLLVPNAAGPHPVSRGTIVALLMEESTRRRALSDSGRQSALPGDAARAFIRARELPGTELVEIRARAPQARLAQAMANAAAGRFAEAGQRELRRAERSRRARAEALRAATERLRRVRERLAACESVHSPSETARKRAGAADALARARAEADAAVAASEAQRARQRALDALARESAAGLARGDLHSPALITSLRQRAKEQEAELHRLESRFTERYPGALGPAREALHETRRQLALLLQREQSAATADPEWHAQLVRDARRAGVDAAASAGRARTAREQQARAAAELERLAGQETTLARARQSASNATAQVLTARAALAAGPQPPDGAPAPQVVQSAPLPVAPVYPRRGRNLLFGLAAGMALWALLQWADAERRRGAQDWPADGNQSSD